MRVGEPVHAVKFTMGVREEHLEEVRAVVEGSVLPTLREAGFREVLAMARRSRLEKVNPEGPGIAGSSLLRNLVSGAPPHGADPGQLALQLPRRLGGDVATGYVHAMKLNSVRRNRPQEYARLRERRLAEQARLTERLLAEENRLRAQGYRVDLYAFYSSEADAKVDAFDIDNEKMAVPHSARFLSVELGRLLFIGLSGIRFTAVHYEAPATEPGRGFPVVQTQLPVAALWEEATGAWIRTSLVSGLRSRPGWARTLVLRSRREGFSGNAAWGPKTLGEHRGVGTEGSPVDDAHPPVPYEMVTLWATEREARDGAKWLEEVMVRSQQVWRPGHSAEADPHTERGEVVAQG